MRHWIDKRIQKLKRSGELGDFLEEYLATRIERFCEKLAFQMDKDRIYEVIVAKPKSRSFLDSTPAQSIPVNPYIFFFEENPETKLVRQCVPWKKISANSFSFLVSVLQDYFVQSAKTKTDTLTPIISPQQPKIFQPLPVKLNSKDLFDLIQQGKFENFKNAFKNFDNKTTIVDERGYTCLHIAAEYGREDFARYLIEDCGFTGKETTSNDKMALAIARDFPAAGVDTMNVLRYLRNVQVNKRAMR